jgi:hypothetical protein
MLPSEVCVDSSDRARQICVLCHRRLVQSLFYDIIYAGMVCVYSFRNYRLIYAGMVCVYSFRNSTWHFLTFAFIQALRSGA